MYVQIFEAVHMYNYVTCEAWKIALNELKSAKKSRGAPPRTPLQKG